MYSNEELERFNFEYQTGWMPREMSIQAYCSRHNVPYKVLDGFIRQLSGKVVAVQINGKPEEDQAVRSQTAVVLPEELKVCTETEVCYVKSRRWSYQRCHPVWDGTEGSRQGMDYVSLRMLVEKLEGLC